MSEMTVAAVVATALREKACGVPRSRPNPAPQPIRRTSGEPVIGSVQQAVLARLPADSVCDLREIRRTMPDRYRPTSVSRAISRLVRSGVLEPVCWNGGTFVPAREAQLRFVRRAPEAERTYPRS